MFYSGATANFAGFLQGSVKFCISLGVKHIRGPQLGGRGGGGGAVIKLNMIAAKSLQLRFSLRDKAVCEVFVASMGYFAISLRPSFSSKSLDSSFS